jgi:hypothetical protein
MSQREMMRRVYRQSGAAGAVRAYAAAERRGDVARVSDRYDLPAEDYARALLRDGLRKGWLVANTK